MGDAATNVRSILQDPRVPGVFPPESARGVYSVLDRFTRGFPPGGMRPVTGHDFNALRQQLRALRDGPGPDAANSAAARQAIDILDAYMLHPPPGALRRGTQADLNTLRATSTQARGDWRALKTSEGVNQAIDYARMRNAGAHSARNLGNMTRQSIQQFTRTPAGQRKLFGATPQELNMIEDVGAGNWFQNQMRASSNRLAAGGGMGQTVASGMFGAGAGTLAHLAGAGPYGTAAATFGGAAVPRVAGSLMRTAGSESTRRAAEGVSEQIRRNSPLYRRNLRAAGPPVLDPRVQARDVITNILTSVPSRATARDQIDQFLVPFEYR
jgi:hypothetical protein